MKGSTHHRPIPRRAFASIEGLIAIAVVAVVLAVAIPVIVRTYPLILSRCTSAGETPGWQQHLMAAGWSALAVVGMLLLLYLGMAVMGQGVELAGRLWERFNAARADFQQHWKDRA